MTSSPSSLSKYEVDFTVGTRRVRAILEAENREDAARVIIELHPRAMIAAVRKAWSA